MTTRADVAGAGLKPRRARRPWRCYGCGKWIHRGEYHGIGAMTQDDYRLHGVPVCRRCCEAKRKRAEATE